LLDLLEFRLGEFDFSLDRRQLQAGKLKGHFQRGKLHFLCFLPRLQSSQGLGIDPGHQLFQLRLGFGVLFHLVEIVQRLAVLNQGNFQLAQQ